MWDEPVTFEKFGEHYLIDAYGCDFDKSNDLQVVSHFVNTVVASTGMVKLSAVEVFQIDGNSKKDSGGVTAFVVVDESHITIHTFPHRLYICADVFTCKAGMDTKSLDEIFKRAFLPQKIKTDLIHRGLEFPSEDIL